MAVNPAPQQEKPLPHPFRGPAPGRGKPPRRRHPSVRPDNLINARELKGLGRIDRLFRQSQRQNQRAGDGSHHMQRRQGEIVMGGYSMTRRPALPAAGRYGQARADREPGAIAFSTQSSMASRPRPGAPQVRQGIRRGSREVMFAEPQNGGDHGFARLGQRRPGQCWPAAAWAWMGSISSPWMRHSPAMASASDRSRQDKHSGRCLHRAAIQQNTETFRHRVPCRTSCRSVSFLRLAFGERDRACLRDQIPAAPSF